MVFSRLRSKILFSVIFAFLFAFASAIVLEFRRFIAWHDGLTYIVVPALLFFFTFFDPVRRSRVVLHTSVSAIIFFLTFTVLETVVYRIWQVRYFENGIPYNRYELSALFPYFAPITLLISCAVGLFLNLVVLAARDTWDKYKKYRDP